MNLKSPARSLFFLGVGCLLLTLAGCPATHSSQGKMTESSPIKPKLVVGIVVDQMRYDYLARYWDNFGKGGFKRLLGEGTTFTQCNFNYVPTETAPGHASIFTGATPAGHGIIMNDWFDPSTIDKGIVRSHSSVEDSLFPYVGVEAARTRGRGASPNWLDATTIADQLKAATQGQAKTVGVSLKDRSAILPVGKTADAAYFFEDLNGSMISSKYYPDTKNGLPAWVDSINALYLPSDYLYSLEGWTLLLPAKRYHAPDGPGDSRYEGQYNATDAPTFPHHFKFLPASGCADFKTTPWGNTFVKDFAKQAIIHKQLGADAVTDFLSVSFSSTDMVAHQFGPQSREVEDTYLRLDRDLADFLSFLDQRIGRGNVLVFLTADHGGAPNPDYAVDHGDKGGWTEAAQLNQRIHQKLGDRPGQDSLLITVKGHTVYLNHRLAKARNLNLDSLDQVVVNETRGFAGIEMAYTEAQVAALDPSTVAGKFLKNGYYPGRSGDVHWLQSYGYLQAPYSVREPFRYKKGTSHGSHFEYDTHVPLLWWGCGVSHKTQATPVEITDIAPTACKMLGISATSKTKGKPMF
jgi:predicted AlkP superfamily pyrophosphatase or phosphodiesterase